ncbi:MAG: hypothetical protein ACYDEV_08000 [Acidiferrobacter sp.]
MKGTFVMAMVLVSSLSLVAVRTAQAAYGVGSFHSHPRAVRVDDDEGDDRGDGGEGWFPLWFGFHAFMPRRRVIIERNYYAPPPPPPEPTYYYFCRHPEGYYPRVPNCPSGWMRVVPSGNPGGPP